VQATVYGVPGSHPVKAAMLMLAHKGIQARRVDLPNGAHRPILRALGFAGTTVPAVKLEGRKLQTTRALARSLDEISPEPGLYPGDPTMRARVEEAERWGDEVLQPVPRRLSFSAPIRRRRADFVDFFEGPLLGIPPRVAVAGAAPLLALSARLNEAADEAVRHDLAALPDMLDHADGLIRDGVIGGPQRNAADFQIAASLRLLMCFDDIRPAIESRPAARLTLEIVPDYAGHVGPALPADWLAPLRTSGA
jgi:glutathione S-transferase